jgi:hypothetical protein
MRRILPASEPQKRAFCIYADAGSNEVRIEAIQTDQGTAFDLSDLPDRSLPSLVLLSEAIGLVAAAAQMLDQQIPLLGVTAALQALGTTVVVEPKF